VVSCNPYYDFFSKILIDLWFTLFMDPTEEAEGDKLSPFTVEQFVKQLVDGMPPNHPGLKI